MTVHENYDYESLCVTPNLACYQLHICNNGKQAWGWVGIQFVECQTSMLLRLVPQCVSADSLTCVCTPLCAVTCINIFFTR